MRKLSATLRRRRGVEAERRGNGVVDRDGPELGVVCERSLQLVRQEAPLRVGQLKAADPFRLCDHLGRHARLLLGQRIQGPGEHDRADPGCRQRLEDLPSPKKVVHQRSVRYASSEESEESAEPERGESFPHPNFPDAPARRRTKKRDVVFGSAPLEHALTLCARSEGFESSKKNATCIGWSNKQLIVYCCCFHYRRSSL